MAEDTPDTPAARELEFMGMDESIGLYADSFLVAAVGEVFQLYFFQNQLPASILAGLQTTTSAQTKQARVLTRVILTHVGMDKLVRAMAGNLGLTVSTREPEES